MKNTLLSLTAALCAFTATLGASPNIPHLVRKDNGATQLHVNGRPYLMIAGELHNSSASTLKFSAPLFPALRSMNVNTVLLPIAWEQFEPQEGVFDYALIDGLIEQAKASNIKLVILWFGTWKNGQSSYPPMWVKEDLKRFPRAKAQDGANLEILSPFYESTMKADAKAFVELMKRIKQVDKDQTVIMIQPQNEPGLLHQDMDYSEAGLAALNGPVPAALLDYLAKHPDEKSPVQVAWAEQGKPKSGNWLQVFGDNIWTREFCIAWHIASFIEYGAHAGQQVYPLPMFVNAWLVQNAKQVPGQYPNGGPVSRVMDIYKAAAPSIFALAPDIYQAHFKDICEDYARPNNPLLIPESTVDAGRAYWAFTELDALCFAPFAIEKRAAGDLAFQQAYAVLNEMADTILAWQGTGKMRGFLRERNETSHKVKLGNYEVEAVYARKKQPSYAFVIQTGDNEFLVCGVNMRMTFTSRVAGKTAFIGQVEEGQFDKDGNWEVTRVLNGDETFHHKELRVMGREPVLGNAPVERTLAPQPIPGQENIFDPETKVELPVPGVYKVRTYLRD